MILILASIISVIGSDICNLLNGNQLTCEQLKPLCHWDNKQCLSGMKIEEPKPIDIFQNEITSYCTTYNTQCSQTYGCAYYEKKCTLFLGCEAYIGKSDYECYQISYLCNWSELKGCYRSSDYDYQGKLNVTRDCSNAPQWLIKEKGCQNYTQYCQFNGLQCVDQLYNCSQYSNKTNCSKLIGIDGQCKNSTTTNKCESNQTIKYCDINSNDCKGTIDNCYFNGQKCQKSPLQKCQLYNINNCEGKIGNDGYCTVKDNSCQVLSCKEQSKFINTSNNENYTFYCQEIKNICIDDQCAYLNQDQCILNKNCTQINNHCIHKEKGCQFYSKEDCPSYCNSNINTYAIIQKSTCIDALSSYECSQMQQLYSSIPCYWSYIDQQCKFVQRCDQLQYAQTDIDCKRFKKDCYFESNQCLDSKQQFCSSFKKQYYCNYENGCVWTNQCISLLFDCTSYQFEYQCFMDIYKRPCVWKQQKCYKYQEHQYLDQNECNIISNKFQFINGTCQVKPKCNIDKVDDGFEGNCNQFNYNLNELNKKSCNDYNDKQQCNKSRFKCIYLNSKCEQLTSCNQIRLANQTSEYCNTNYTECSQMNHTNCISIKGINQQEFRYCKKIAGKCMQVLPINEIDCYLYGQYDGNYCQEIDDKNICYPRMIQIPQDFSFSNTIMIYILILFLIL